MIIATMAKLGAVATIACVLGGCTSTQPDGIAMIEIENVATNAAVLATLRQAMGVQDIILGPHEAGVNSMITVLPPPLGDYETRSTALPEIFDVMMRKNSCYLVRRTTGVAYALNNVACVVPPKLPQ